MNPLEGPRAKIARARADLSTLSDEMVGLFDTHPFHVEEAEFDSRLRATVYRATGGPASLPVEWGVTVGDIAHNLRAALDGLAWQLALLQGPRPYQRTAFPVHIRGTTTRRDASRNLLPHFWNHRNGTSNREIQSIDPKYWPRIEGFQPYKRGNGHRNSPLFRLSELNNTDKHRLVAVINPVVGNVRWSGLSGGTRFNKRATLRSGAKVGHVTQVPADKKLFTFNVVTGKVDRFADGHKTSRFELSAGVRFGHTCEAVKGLGVVSTLSQMVGAVSGVIDAFAAEFEAPVPA